MREKPGPTKLTHFQWWLCFWLAVLAINVGWHKPIVKVYLNDKQVETVK